jgi:hypothetical protein
LKAADFSSVQRGVDTADGSIAESRVSVRKIRRFFVYKGTVLFNSQRV